MIGTIVANVDDELDEVHDRLRQTWEQAFRLRESRKLHDAIRGAINSWSDYGIAGARVLDWWAAWTLAASRRLLDNSRQGGGLVRALQSLHRIAPHLDSATIYARWQREGTNGGPAEVHSAIREVTMGGDVLTRRAVKDEIDRLKTVHEDVTKAATKTVAHMHAGGQVPKVVVADIIDLESDLLETTRRWYALVHGADIHTSTDGITGQDHLARALRLYDRHQFQQAADAEIERRGPGYIGTPEPTGVIYVYGDTS